jgi:hypothetical protein
MRYEKLQEEPVRKETYDNCTDEYNFPLSTAYIQAIFVLWWI